MSNSIWAPLTDYAQGSLIIDSNGNIAECTTPGVSGAVSPSWATIVGSTVRDGTVVWTVRMLVTPGDTTKLVEEAKLYWTVQSLIAPATGYLLSHLTFTNRLQDSVFCLLALVPIIVGTVYNIVGAGYIYEARGRTPLPIRRDFFCGWMAIAYLVLGGLTVGLLTDSIGDGFKYFWVGFFIGFAMMSLITRLTYENVEIEMSRALLDFDKYLRDVRVLFLCDRPRTWSIVLCSLVLAGVLALMLALFVPHSEAVGPSIIF
jgi:hypothetical protein